MLTVFAKITRPLLASALVLGMGMGIASAYDYCNPCRSRPKPKPVVVRSSCSPCASGVVSAPSYSNYNANYGSSYNTGIAVQPTSATSYATSTPAYSAPTTYDASMQPVPTMMRVPLNPGEEIPEVPGL